MYFLLLTGLAGCDLTEIFPGKGTDVYESPYGSIEFDFAMPDHLTIPLRGIHRIDLSISSTADSLYRKEYLTCANVSDYQQKYSFSLLPGRYFYQAGITCTFGGDTCLYGGFPGGQNSTWWAMGWVDVEKGKSFTKNIVFQ